jgi:hypothetical protein
MRKLFALVLVFALAGCAGLGGEPTKAQTYQTIGSACIAGTGTLNTLSPMKAQGRLTKDQIEIIDAAADAIHPICNNADIPSYEWALQVLNVHVWALNGVLFDATGGASGS